MAVDKRAQAWDGVRQRARSCRATERATVWRMNRPWVKNEGAPRVDEAPSVSNGATEIHLVTLELTGEPDPAGRQPAESFLVRVSSVGRFLCSPSRRDAVDFRGIRKTNPLRYRCIVVFC